MLDRIWSGWRAAYVTNVSSRQDGREASPETQGSVFTQLLKSAASDEDTYIVHRGELVFAILNIHPYTSGHVLVLPYREVADLSDLTPGEATELWATVTRTVDVVRSAYAPDGVNVGLNLGQAAGGSVPTHLHVHVVPRWTGDSNFMSSIANAQTLPEALSVSATRLRGAFGQHLPTGT
jgi:ATP adenylyltransferase